jgi:hypothetical protein
MLLLLLLLLLQIADGTRKAKSTTRREFEDLMVIFVKDAKDRLAAHGLEAKFSYDNNKIQATADLRRMGVGEGEKVPLAPYMPDGHKVIEHAVGNVKRAVQAMLYGEGWLDRRRDFTPSVAQELVKEAFKGLSKEGIREDIESLPSTYLVISAPRGAVVQAPNGKLYKGTGGDWAPAELR